MKCYYFSLKEHEPGSVLINPWVIIGEEEEVRRKPYVSTDYMGKYVWMHYLGDILMTRIEPDNQFADWGKIKGEITVLEVDRVRNPLLDMENPDSYCPWRTWREI